MNAQVSENLVAVTIARPNSAASDRAQAALNAAQAILIATPEQYADAASELQGIKAKWAEIESQRKELVRPINEAHDRVQKFFSGPLDYLKRAEAIVKGKLADYQREQEKIRLEEQRRANEKARKEREEIEARAREAERKAREKAEAERKAAAEAAAAGRAAEAAKLKARADATESKGAEKAAVLEQQAAAVVAPVIQREAPKVAGLATREKWCFEVVDPTKVNRPFLCPDEQKIGASVRALKADAQPVIGDGVRVWCENAIASRGKA